MTWTDDAADITDACFEAFGAAAVFVPAGGGEIPTSAIVRRQTLLLGELGQVLDPRPSVELPSIIVDDAQGGTVAVGSRTWTLIERIDDDGELSRWWVQ